MFIDFLVLLIINFLGIIIQKYFNLPFPGTIIGMVIFFTLLYFKILKKEFIENICNYLVKIMPLFFLPPLINLLEHLHLLKNDIFKIFFVLIITTIITMVVTAKTVEFFIKLKEKK